MFGPPASELCIVRYQNSWSMKTSSHIIWNIIWHSSHESHTEFGNAKFIFFSTRTCDEDSIKNSAWNAHWWLDARSRSSLSIPQQVQAKNTIFRLHSDLESNSDWRIKSTSIWYVRMERGKPTSCWTHCEPYSCRHVQICAHAHPLNSNQLVRNDLIIKKRALLG